MIQAPPGKEVRIPFKDYPELTKAGGMVRVETSKVGVVFVRAEDAGTFSGISAVCTHQGATVNPTSDGFKCPRHGSTYDREGHNTGGPARRPLARFPAFSVGEAVVLKLEAMIPAAGGG